ncbi:MAG TPA: ABC transporter permease subunit [Blastocatellia bacterium]|nr:ABC transporter permease subunit [Blastocatellia bacterium]
MFKTIFSKEIREGIYTYKFLLIVLCAMILVPLSLYSGARTYKEQVSQFQRAEADSDRTVKTQEPKAPHTAAHFGIVVSKPPAPLLGVAIGVHDALGIRSRIDPHQTPQLTGSLNETAPMLSAFGHFDFAFIVQTLFSLLALIYSFNLVSGEKEAGTLRLMFANAVSRSDVILGKAAAGFAMLLGPLAAASLAGLLFLTPLFGISLRGGAWIRLVAIFLASASYIALFFFLGTLVSTRTTRTMSSIIILILIWASLNFVIPRVAVMIAQSIYPAPSVQQVDMQVEAIRREETDKSVKRFQAYRNEHPDFKDKPLPSDVAVALRRQTDEAMEEREGKLMESYEARKRQQVRLAINLSRLSPCSAYANAVMELAGTGVFRHERFLRLLDEYRRDFRGYFDDLERQNVKTVNSFDNVPMFSFHEEATGSVIGRVTIDVGVITIVTVILFAGAYFSFVRYDIR